MAIPVVTERKCSLCGTPISSNSSMEQVVTQCRRANCNHRCIRRLSASQNINLCPVCKSLVGRNRFAPILGSANTIDYNRNNVPAADRRTEASFDFSGFIRTFCLYWPYIIIFIIIIVILCVISRRPTYFDN